MQCGNVKQSQRKRNVKWTNKFAVQLITDTEKVNAAKLCGECFWNLQ